MATAVSSNTAAHVNPTNRAASAATTAVATRATRTPFKGPNIWAEYASVVPNRARVVSHVEVLVLLASGVARLILHFSLDSVFDGDIHFSPYALNVIDQYDHGGRNLHPRCNDYHLDIAGAGADLGNRSSARHRCR